MSCSAYACSMHVASLHCWHCEYPSTLPLPSFSQQPLDSSWLLRIIVWTHLAVPVQSARARAADPEPHRAALQAEQERFVVKPFSMRGSVAAEKAAASRASSGPAPAPAGHLLAPAVRYPSCVGLRSCPVPCCWHA